MLVHICHGCVQVDSMAAISFDLGSGPAAV